MVPFLQGVAGECLAGAAALVGQHRDLVHQVWMLRPTRGNGVGSVPDVLGDKPRDNRFHPQPQLLPQLRGTTSRRLPQSEQQPHIPKTRICSGPPVAARSSSRYANTTNFPDVGNGLHQQRVCGTPGHRLGPGSAAIPRRRASTSAAVARASAVCVVQCPWASSARRCCWPASS